MTVTDRAIEWLDQNRHRAYPFESSGWRAVVPQSSGLDCVVLDALVFDSSSGSVSDFVIESINVTDERTEISMSYSGASFSVNVEPSEGDRDFETIRFDIDAGGRNVSASMSFSSHAYILEKVGKGAWEIGCRLLRSRVVSLSDGEGVSGIRTNGSSGVSGHSSPSTSAGEVVLEDGYRTSPIVWNGRVFVRVGTRYGLNPCKYDYGEDGSTDCRKPLFFFCGQNAVNNGNIVLKGGRGISVAQGRLYEVRDQNSRLYGKKIPCIEIIAGSELLGMYGDPQNSSFPEP